MKLSISQSKTYDVLELALAGRLTLGEETRYFDDTIKATLADGNKKMVLNLTDLVYMDSAGLGLLISSFSAVTDKGGEIRLKGLNGKVHDVLRTAKLLTVFEVIEDHSMTSQTIPE